MTRDPEIDAALRDPWEYLDHQATGSTSVQQTAWRHLGDMGRVEDSVRQNYTGRYPIELLQNAHDASEDGGVVGTVRFVVTDTALLVANEGVPFTADRIRSLTRLGSSEKAARRTRRRLIGYKGVGFASVFEVTDRPQVISRTAQFAFDRQEAVRRIEAKLGPARQEEVVPARYFPLELPRSAWVQDGDVIEKLLGDGAATVIRLPFRNGWTSATVADAVVETLAPEVLLFMPAVDALELRSSDRNWAWNRRSIGEVGRGEHVALIGQDGERRAWIVRRSWASISPSEAEALRDELWAHVRKLNVGVAIPWTRGRVAEPTLRPLFAYFPTDDMVGRGVLVHGDFYLDTTRRHVAARGAQGVVSGRVATDAARLLAGLAESMWRQGHRLLDCLTPQDHPEGFGHTVGEAIDKALEAARIIRPARGGRPLRVNASLRIPGNVSVEDERKLVSLLTRAGDLVHPGDDRGAAGDWLANLGSTVMATDAFAGRIDPDRGDIPYAATLNLLERWLTTLDWHAAHLAVEGLKRQRVIQDTDRRWRRPDEVMWPTEGAPHLPPKLARTELLVPTHPVARRFLDRLDIEPLTPDAAIDILATAIRDRRFGQTDDERRQALDFALAMWRLDSDAVTLQRLGLLPVPARAARRRGAPTWRRADATYVSGRWSGDRSLEHLYGPFGVAEFLAEEPPAGGTARVERLRFFQALGVATQPRAVDVGEQLAHFDDWRQLPEVETAWECYEGRHHWAGRHVRGTVIDRLDEILKCLPAHPRLAAALVDVLLAQPEPYGPEVEVTCAAGDHKNRARPRRAPGYQRWRLQTTPWIPVTGDPLGAELGLPGDTWANPGRGLEGLMVPRAAVKVQQAQRLGFVSLDRPAPGAVERALGRLAEAHPDLRVAPRNVVESATNLARRLDRAILRGSHRGTAPLLPAQDENGWTWTISPAVGVLPGMPAMPGLAVLPGGPWRGLRRAYGLPSLRSLVESDVLPGRARHAAALLPVQQRVELLALLTRLDAPEKEIANRLAALRESSHAWITVRWKLRGSTVETAGPVDFHLALEQNQAGAVIGARLMRDATRTVDPIAVGQALTEYLDAPDHEAEIELYLHSPSALLSRRGITGDELDEAGRLLRSRRRYPGDPEPAPPPEASAKAESGGPRPEVRVPEPRPRPGLPPNGRRQVRELLEPAQLAFGAPRRISTPEGTDHGGRRRRAGQRGQQPPRRPDAVDWVTPDDEVERRAMEVVTRYGLEQAGAIRVVDVHAQNLGWDLEFHFADGTWWPVEAKGTSGEGFFIITPNEWRSAQQRPDYLLCQVAGIANPRRAVLRIYRDLGRRLTEDLMSGLSWAVTGWQDLEPDEVPLASSDRAVASPRRPPRV